MRRYVLPLLLSSIAYPAAAQVAEDSVEQRDTVIITGQRLEDSRAALDACMARDCPPVEEITATVRHAENAFVAGQYRVAHDTLRKGMARNRRHDAVAPLAVSELIRAHSQIAAHMGLNDVAKAAAIDNARMLRKQVGDAHPNSWVAAAEVGDALVRSGRPDAARFHYSKLAKDARERGERGFEGFVLLRQAALELALAERMITPASQRTLATLDSLIASDVPEHRNYADAARMIKAGFMARRGDEDALETAINVIRTSPDKPPQLLFAPAIKLDERPAARSPHARFLDSVDDNWADIGFFVKPDGRTTDVQVLRTGEQFENSWANRVITSIAGRRYAPRAMEATDPGSFRIERFTYTSDHQLDFGSRLMARPGRPTLQRIDLTVEKTASR